MLNNLKPTEGSRKEKTRRCRGLGLDLDLKVVNYHSSELFQREDLKITVIKNMPLLMSHSLIDSMMEMKSILQNSFHSVSLTKNSMA